jgi:hypothetical protein
MSLLLHRHRMLGVGEAAPVPLILDEYPTDLFALSLERLRNGFTGDPIRVRRTSDSSEMDIPFGMDGWIDEAALLSFVGAGDGEVVVWRNQQGFVGDFNSTGGMANFPKIVRSGVVEKINGRPALYFDATMGIRSPNLSSALSQPSTYYALIQADASYSTVVNHAIVSGTASATRQLTYYRNSGKHAIFAGTLAEASLDTNADPHLVTSIFNSGSSLGYLDGTQIISGNAGSLGINTSNGITIGYDQINNFPWFGKISEVVGYASNQAANRVSFETNRMNAYSI